MADVGAGQLDRRIQFRRNTPGEGSLGVTENWAAHGAPVPAMRKDISDGERWRAGEVGATITTRFTVRSSSFTRDVTPKDRLVCEGREYEISGIKEIGRRDFLEITASARADR